MMNYSLRKLTLWIGPIMRPMLNLVIFSACCSLIQAVIDVFRAVLLENMLDSSVNQIYEEVYKSAYLLGGLIVLGVTFRFLIKYWSHLFAAKVNEDIRNRFYKSIIFQSLLSVNQYNTGDLTSRTNVDTEEIKRLFSTKIHEYIYLPIMFILSFSYLLTVNWKLVVVSIVLMPGSIYLVNKLSVPLEKMSMQIQGLLGQIGSNLFEAIRGISIIKTFQLENIFQNRFITGNVELFNYQMQVEKKRSQMEPLIQLQRWGTYFVCTIYSAYLGVRGEINPGEVLVFLIMINYLINPITALPDLINNYRLIKAAASRIQEITDVPSESYGTPFSFSSSKSIVMKDVTFQYGQREEKAISEISLKLSSNSLTAIVGPSGSGKTTLISILSGLYPITAGEYIVFGTTVNEQNRVGLQEHIAVVPQLTYLFPGSIMENLLNCGKAINETQVKEACEEARAHEFIINLPSGYETRIGEGGLELSGGQKQRLAIARALLKDTPIIIFDEPTSALDPDSAQIIDKLIENISHLKTVIVVTHKLTSIYNADKIIVLDQGRISQTGTYHTLIQEEGIYRNLISKTSRNRGIIHS
jgi:ABC-type multidrug transport system fused ATPase/permease subunit